MELCLHYLLRLCGVHRENFAILSCLLVVFKRCSEEAVCDSIQIILSDVYGGQNYVNDVYICFVNTSVYVHTLTPKMQRLSQSVGP